jgi:hypothetical protein
MGIAAPKPLTFPDAQGAVFPEGNNDLSVHVGKERPVSGGVFDNGTHEEDGPGTWEALASPRHLPVGRRAGDPSPTHDMLTGARVVGHSGTEQAPASREATGKGNQSRGRWGQGVGGLHRSGDVGERGGVRTRPSKGGPC